MLARLKKRGGWGPICKHNARVMGAHAGLKKSGGLGGHSPTHPTPHLQAQWLSTRFIRFVLARPQKRGG